MQELLNQVLNTLRGMWKFRWPGLIVAWVVAVVGVVVVWRIPDQFEAAARIYVDTDTILKPLMSGLAVQPNVEQQISMLSRTLISRPNLEKLVRMADLDLKNQSKADQEALIERLQKGIAMRTAGGANLYLMSYRDPEPEKAKRVIQSMVSIFVESGMGASRKDTDSAKSFLTEQIKIFEARLEEAETRMKEFRLRNIDRQGVDGKDVASRMAEVGTQLEAARLQLREAERSRDAAKRQLAEARGQSPSTSALPNLAPAPGATLPTGVPVGNFATPEIDTRIQDQRRNLDGLLQRYTDQHPDVQNARRLIGELEEQKRREVAELQRRAQAAAVAAAQAAAAAPRTATAPGESLAVQEMSRMLATAEVQVAAMQARVDEYAGRMAQVRQQLKTAPQIEAEAAQLNRDYAIIKKNYEDLVSRRQSAVMSGELDVATGVAEFKLIDPPRVAPRPVSPNRLLLLPAVLFTSLALGIAFAFAAVQVRPTFGHSDELRQKTGLPLLGVVSALITDADRRRERASMFRFVTASGGLVGIFVAGLIAMIVMNRYGA
ncbi:MAG: chain length-determining protein [Burkholderiales bacterium]|nr:chain length-determining protein [Burkholderiales bacterium]